MRICRGYAGSGDGVCVGDDLGRSHGLVGDVMRTDCNGAETSRTDEGAKSKVVAGGEGTLEWTAVSGGPSEVQKQVRREEGSD